MTFDMFCSLAALLESQPKMLGWFLVAWFLFLEFVIRKCILNCMLCTNNTYVYDIYEHIC